MRHLKTVLHSKIEVRDNVGCCDSIALLHNRSSTSAIKNGRSMVTGLGFPSGVVYHGLTTAKITSCNVNWVACDKNNSAIPFFQGAFSHGHMQQKINPPICDKLMSHSKSICWPRDRVRCSFSYTNFNLLQSFLDSMCRCHGHIQCNLTKLILNFLASPF